MRDESEAEAQYLHDERYVKTSSFRFDVLVNAGTVKSLSERIRCSALSV